MHDDQPTYDELKAQLDVAHRTIAALRGEADDDPHSDQARLADLYDALNVGTLVRSADGTFTQVNETACRLLGMREEEILGRRTLRPDSELTLEDGTPVPEEEYPSVVALRTGKPVLNAVRGLISSDRSRSHWILLNARPLPDPAGGPPQKVIVSSYDITEVKKAEEKRRKLDAQVQQAQKLESLGVLAGGIAHDFNNILTTILGNTDLALRDMSEHAPARDSVTEIEKAALRAADLAKQMLAYSGHGTLAVKPIDLNELLTEMMHLLKVSVSRSTILKTDFAGALPAINVDARQIRQVVLNLVTNASEAIGEQCGVISLSTGAVDCDLDYIGTTALETRLEYGDTLREGLYAYIEVTDTGCGMDAETQAMVFDPFFTTKFIGRGLGLAVVLGIARGHHAMIKIDSEKDRGTTFRVLFPTIETPATEMSTSVDGEDEEEWRSSGLVLLADDEETVRAIAKKQLEWLGFDVLTTVDGRDALTTFTEHASETRLVLLDLTMPHMDGEAVYEAIREIRDDVPVILSSGYEEQDITERLACKGLDGFMQKPYQLADLRKVIRQALEAKASA